MTAIPSLSATLWNLVRSFFFSVYVPWKENTNPTFPLSRAPRLVERYNRGGCSFTESHTTLLNCASSAFYWIPLRLVGPTSILHGLYGVVVSRGKSNSSPPSMERHKKRKPIRLLRLCLCLISTPGFGPSTGIRETWTWILVLFRFECRRYFARAKMHVPSRMGGR